MLLMAAFSILATVLLLTRRSLVSSREIASSWREPTVDAREKTVLTPIQHEERGLVLDIPLDPSVELWSRRSEARAIGPPEPAPRAFATRRLGGGARRVESKDDPEIREHALSWCAIVGIPEEKRKDVADLVVRTQVKWQSLCAGAGSATTVNSIDLEALREWRRNELGHIVGFDAGDAFIAGIKTRQGF